MRNKIIIASVLILAIVGIILINNAYSIEEEVPIKEELKIKIQDIKEVEEINEVEEKVTKREDALPTINDKKIDNINFTFHNPGDYLTFLFDIVNTSSTEGKIAKINIDNIKCNGEYSEEELTSICNNISIDLVYGNSNKEIKENDIIFANSTTPINVMITYDNGPTTKEDVDVTIENLSIGFEFTEATK